MEYVAFDGSIVAHREYDPFGGTVVATGNADAFTHWFSTKPWCNVTGLSEYQYRKYSPAMGRWLNRDPIGEKGGVALYVLCFNRTLLSADALGSKKNEMPISSLDLVDYGISNHNQKKIYHTWDRETDNFHVMDSKLNDIEKNILTNLLEDTHENRWPSHFEALSSRLLYRISTRHRQWRRFSRSVFRFAGAKRQVDDSTRVKEIHS